MSNEQKKIIPINYTNREFEGIRRDLIQIAERYYPDTFRDFSEGSFGAMMVDAVAYIGDQLSFYLDYNVNESFLDTAYQPDNVLRIGRTLGYKDPGVVSTYGRVAFFILVPASATGIGPDNDYVPILKRGTRLSAQNGLNFVLTKNVDFSAPENPVVAARTDASTGAPTYYAIKAYGDVVSGQFGTIQVSCGAYERFKKISLGSNAIAEIISVFDSEGNEYFEVDYLAQDMIFKEVSNKNFKNDNVPSILKPTLVSRKFVVQKTTNTVVLQFGSGDASQTDVVADPATVAIDSFGKSYTTDLTFDPTRLTKNQSFGIVPSDTTLTVTYRLENVNNTNVSVGGLNTIGNAIVQFEDENLLASSVLTTIRDSIECINEEPIIGSVTNASTEELKQRVYDTFPTQNRAVTQADYENIVYRMPSKFGSIKRVSAQRDPNSERRNLNMYVISEDNFGKLIKTNSTIKNNLKTWLNNYRMLSDTIDILDAYIINFGVEFIVSAKTNADKFDVLERCISQLQNSFRTNYFIGEHVQITDIYNELNKVDGVSDVVSVKLVNKTDNQYSAVSFDINNNLSRDGTSVVIPKNAVAELKFPATDIRGKIR
jgi:hypothetical protein